MQGFQPVELNILEYQEERGSHIAPHFDDFWIWGERIIGINLLEATTMTFYKTIGKTPIEIEIFVPKRSMYLISGKSRTLWMHGIKQEHIRGRRMVLTLREVASKFKSENEQTI